MATPIRTLIIDKFVTELKRINGTEDNQAGVPYAPYTFKSNVFNNVARRFKYWDEINDFPYLTISVIEEVRRTAETGIQHGNMLVLVRGYVRGENTQDLADDLAEDIDYVINTMGTVADGICLIDFRTSSIRTDEGLLEPFGVVDVTAEVIYEQYGNVSA